MIEGENAYLEGALLKFCFSPILKPRGRNYLA
jgi:hypothetical protein